VPVKEAIGSLSAPGWSSSLAGALLDEIESGKSLGEAMAARVGEVPAEHAGLVIAGERAGKLVEMIDRILLDLAAGAEMRGALFLKTAYPLAVLAIAAVLLPLPMVFQGGLGSYLLLELAIFAPVLAVLLVIRRMSRRSGSGALGVACERVLLVTPFLERHIRQSALARSLHVLGLSLEAGLGFAESLQLAARATRWRWLRGELEEVEQEIRRGKSAAQAFRWLSGLSETALRRLEAGERAGNIDRGCIEIARELREHCRWRLEVLLPVVSILLYLAAGGFVLWRFIAVLRTVGY
jgi:type II secretory pathway component PulF